MAAQKWEVLHLKIDRVTWRTKVERVRTGDAIAGYTQKTGDAIAGYPSFTAYRLLPTAYFRPHHSSFTSGSFFSVITGHWVAISAFKAVKSFHCSGRLSSWKMA